MPKPLAKPVRDVLAGHRARLTRLIDRRGPGTLKKVYDGANRTLMRHITASVKAGKGDTFGVHQKRIVLAQVQQGQALMARRLAGDMRDLTLEAQKEAIRGVATDINALSTYFTGAEIELPIEEAAVFQGLIDGRESSLLRMHQESFARYGARVTGDIEEELTRSLILGETPIDAIDRVQAALDGEWWQAERIVRTETAYAFNGAQKDAIEESADDVEGGLWLMWSEHVDGGGSPLDDRVGVDSLAMHGQVVKPGEEFVMPPTAPDGKPVSDSLVGETWEFPPNRPNDRATVLPWNPSWGMPGWEWKGGKRVPVR